MTAKATAPSPPPTAPLRLVFRGECVAGHDPRSVREAVAMALKLDDTRAARLFSGRRVVLRSAVDEATALRYVSRFRQLGAVLQVEPGAVAPAAAQARTPAPAPRPAAARVQAHPRTPPPARAAARTAQAAPPVQDPLSWELPWRSIALGLGAVTVGALSLLLGMSVLDTLREPPPQVSVEAVLSVAGAPARVDARATVPATVPHPPVAASVAAASRGAPDAALPSDMGPAARIDYRQHYLPAAGHKAFALGGSGHDWHVGAASEDEAREAALTLCMRQQATARTGCRIVDVDGELTE